MFRQGLAVDSETLATYWRSGGVNPVGGVEAIATRLIGEALDKPCAHGPVDYALTGFKEVVDLRIAVEIITENFVHCLLKGLHKAPRLSRERGMSNVENYHEAAGMIMAIKAGVHPASVCRPLAHTKVTKATI